MSGSGKAWLWVLLIATALGGWYYFKVYCPWISEPAVKDQIKAQVTAIQSGAEVALPIPIIIGNRTVKRLDFGMMDAALKGTGFMEKHVPEGSLEGNRKAGLKIDCKWYLDSRSGNYVNIMHIVSDHGSGNWLCATVNESIYSWQRSQHKIDKSIKPGRIGIGPLRLGMSEERVNRAIARIPHDSMAEAFEARARDRLIPGVSLETAKSITGATTFTKSEGIHLARGLYFYTLQFESGVLARIIVEDVTQILNSVGMNDETYAAVLAEMFDV
jgi:hypothetical protein